jgi:hypothetical protein
MSATTPAPLRCAQARTLLSARLDGAEVGAEVERHLVGCTPCAHFEATALELRRALRLPSLDDGRAGDDSPALTAAIMDAVATEDLLRVLIPPPAPDRSRPGRPVGLIRASLAGVAVFALCAAIGFATVRWRGGAMPAMAADRSSVVSDGQVLVHSMQAAVSLVEVGADGSPAHRADGSLTYIAPESVVLQLSDGTTTSEVGVNGEVAWRTGTDPGAVRGREPFDPAGWSALEVVVPVDAFGRDPGEVVAAELDGHRAWQISTTVAQVSELLDAFRTGFTWRPLDASDRARLWLDRTSGVPLRVEVSPADGPDRATWAARQGLAEPPVGPTFVIELADVVVNGPSDSGAGTGRGRGRDAVEVPAPPDLTGARDLGFVDRLVAPAELPEPAWLPDGMAPYRAGERRSQGASGPVVERTWTNGRSWLKITGTHRWTADRLFGDIGPLVRPIVVEGQRYYRSEDGGAVAVHAADLDLVVTGSVSEHELLRVAGSLGVVALPAPDGWPEAASVSLDDLFAGTDQDRGALGTQSVLAPEPGAVAGADGVALDRAGSIEVSVTGPGPRGVRIIESPGAILAPVEDPDARAVPIRGLTGRFSPTLGELAWVERGHVIVMSTHTVAFEDVLALADALRWIR